MATIRTERDGRAELRAWYLRGLLPKLADAVDAGKVAPAAAEPLDRQLREFLGIEGRNGREAA